jgi:hypothetical protein
VTRKTTKIDEVEKCMTSPKRRGSRRPTIDQNNGDPILFISFVYQFWLSLVLFVPLG